VRDFFRSLCAAISQELADGAAKKNGEKPAKFASCGKQLAVDRSPLADRVFRDVTRGTTQ